MSYLYLHIALGIYFGVLWAMIEQPLGYRVAYFLVMFVFWPVMLAFRLFAGGFGYMISAFIPSRGFNG